MTPPSSSSQPVGQTDGCQHDTLPHPSGCSFDLVISRADIIDGSGSPRFQADVGITGDRIAAIGDAAEWQAGKRIDGTGLVLAPGFIDVHTHDDNAVFTYPQMTPKVSQGVTTVIAGNCGISLAPSAFKGRPADPASLLGGPDDYRFPTMRAYRDAFDAAPSSVNVAMLVGHSTLRIDAMENDITRPATNAEISQMRAKLDKALEDGAIGMSTGLAYPAANAAPTEEVISLAKALPAHEGIFTTHMRDEADGILESIDETVRIGAESGARLVISHHKCVGERNWGRSQETLARIEEARNTFDLDLDVYPYVASSTVLLIDWIDEATRILVTWSEPYPDLGGKDLADIAADWGVTRVEAAKRLLPAGAIYFKMAEEDLQRILAHRRVMVGSDGLPMDPRPHPRLWGTFPRVLGHYVRELDLMPLEEAVYRMTGLSAEVFGLKDRGTIREGAIADITLFDPDTILDRATFDSPEDAAEGVSMVMVGGTTVWQSGRHSGARPGQFISR